MCLKEDIAINARLTVSRPADSAARLGNLVDLNFAHRAQKTALNSDQWVRRKRPANALLLFQLLSQTCSMLSNQSGKCLWLLSRDCSAMSSLRLRCSCRVPELLCGLCYHIW